MPLTADLYLDQIDLARHVGAQTCDVCHVDSLEGLLDRLRSGRICSGVCPHWPPHRVEAFQMAIDAAETLPVIPSLETPRPTDVGMTPLNEPTHGSPVLVTGNSQLTHDVLLAVLSNTSAPIWMAAVDTGGNTLDMSLVYRTFTPDGVARVLQPGGFTGRVILAGLAEPLGSAVAEALGRPVEIGPICAAELPLFLGDDWAGR